MTAPPVRDVQLGDLENARDLGGYRTADGRQLRWGVLYRAASLHEVGADAATVAQWSGLGLTTVIDLRRDDERERRGEVSVDLHPAGALHLPAHLVPYFPDLDLERPEEFLAACYADILVHGTDTVREILRLLGSEDNLPLVVFCAAGKDRTGTVIALVLSALGVDDDTICDDYAMSGDRIAAMVQRKRAASDDRDPMVDQHPTILRAPRGAMALFLDVLRRRGGIETVLAGMGVTRPMLDAVRDTLLEPVRIR